MTRAKNGVRSNAKHQKFLKKYAKGYMGRASNCFRVAKQRVHQGWLKSYVGRRNKRRMLRGLWIQRINAAARCYEISYSKLMKGLKLDGSIINRKTLSELASLHIDKFKWFVEIAKKALSANDNLDSTKK